MKEQAPDKTSELRLEQVLAMSKRLANAIAADIKALENGKFDELATADPEIERLCALYGREVTALKAAGGIRGASEEMIAALKESGERLNGLLARHGHLVLAMRNAAEGLIKTVAEEVEKVKRSARPYCAQPGKRSSSGAIIYNRVV